MTPDVPRLREIRAHLAAITEPDFVTIADLIGVIDAVLAPSAPPDGAAERVEPTLVERRVRASAAAYAAGREPGPLAYDEAEYGTYKPTPAPVAADGRAHVVGDRLVIAFTLEGLAVGSTSGPYFDRVVAEIEKEPRVTDKTAWARELARALNAESENGTTLVHEMLDRAAERAFENGAEGIEIAAKSSAAPVAAPAAGEAIETMAEALWTTWRAGKPDRDDCPTWKGLLAEGHQGMHRANDFRALARTALAARPAAVTEEMVEAGARAWAAATGYRWDDMADDVRKAMRGSARTILTAALTAGGARA